MGLAVKRSKKMGRINDRWLKHKGHSARKQGRPRSPKMRFYGMDGLRYENDDSPPSRYAPKMKSHRRREIRRIVHKRGRRLGKASVREFVLTEGGRDE